MYFLKSHVASCTTGSAGGDAAPFESPLTCAGFFSASSTLPSVSGLGMEADSRECQSLPQAIRVVVASGQGGQSQALCPQREGSPCSPGPGTSLCSSAARRRWTWSQRPPTRRSGWTRRRSWPCFLSRSCNGRPAEEDPSVWRPGHERTSVSKNKK